MDPRDLGRGRQPGTTGRERPARSGKASSCFAENVVRLARRLPMRDLPLTAAAIARHPVVVRTHSGSDLQQELQHRWIGFGGELPLAHVPRGRRVVWVEFGLGVDDWLGDGLEATPALSSPVSVFELVPGNRDVAELPRRSCSRRRGQTACPAASAYVETLESPFLSPL